VISITDLKLVTALVQLLLMFLMPVSVTSLSSELELSLDY